MRNKRTALIITVFGCTALSVRAQTPLGTALTYQGRLTFQSVAANGLHDFQFQLFADLNGTISVAGPICLDGVDVSNGLFTVDLDFGAVFTGEKRFLKISVRKDSTGGNCGGGVYTTLSPLQELTAAPYALGVRLPLVEAFDTGGNEVQLTNNSTGRVLAAIRGGAGGLAAIRADSAGDSALFAQGSTATAEGVTAIATGGADALVAQAQGLTGHAASFAITSVSNPDPALVAMTAGTGLAALLDGRVDIGANGSNTGDLQIYHSGSVNEQIRARGSSSGGMLDLFDEAGNFHSGFEADTSGTGGFAYVYRSAANQGFIVDGNTGANEPRVTISGSTRSAVFDMAASGNGSVALPADAISASECLDEPGVASDKEGTAGVAITSTTLTTIISRTITAPSAGFVLVLGTTQFQIPHTTGTNDTYNIGVSDSSSALPDNQDLLTTVISALPSATYQKAVTAHGLFPVSAGANTFFFLGQKTAAGSADATAFDVQFTLVYIPTAYGTVVGTGAGLGAGANDDGLEPESDVERSTPMRFGLTPEEIATEREQSILEDQARLVRELNDMRARFDALETELKQIMQAQHESTIHAAEAKPVHPIKEGE